tara:strand:+ start:3234 stop:3491 length:258 start_codon:yes stop_codon:yes gene_type:complete
MIDKRHNNIIDPALEHLAAFNKATLSVSQDIQTLRKKTIFSDGAFSKKIKAFMAMICGINEPWVELQKRGKCELGSSNLIKFNPK